MIVRSGKGARVDFKAYAFFETFPFFFIIGLGLVIPQAVCIVGSNIVQAAEVNNPMGGLPPATPLLLTCKIGLAAALSSTLF